MRQLPPPSMHLLTLAFCWTAFALTLCAETAAPVITIQPASATVRYGQQVALSVQASGASLGYQWFLGSSNDITHPLFGATNANYRTHGVITNESYWVRVSNSGGQANSQAAGVTVTPHTVLYYTDFETAPAGSGHWSAMAGWYGDETNAVGILNTNSALGVGTGQAAYIGKGASVPLGFAACSHDFPFRPLQDASKINITMDLQIFDSTNNKFHDAFDICIADASHKHWADFQLDNSSKLLWICDESKWTPLGYFKTNTLYHLWIGIDCKSNTWSATLNNQPAFSDVTFIAGSTNAGISLIMFDWSVIGEGVGGNAMVIDNLGVAVEGSWGPQLTLPVRSGKRMMIDLETANLQNVTLQVSTNLIDWNTLTNFLSETTNRLFDAFPTNEARFYRAVVAP